MQENVISPVSGTTRKMKLFYETYYETHLMENINEEKNLVHIINKELSFKSHMNELHKKGSQKTGALCRLSSNLNNSQKKVFTSIIKAQFNYCLLPQEYSNIAYCSFQNEK